MAPSVFDREALLDLSVNIIPLVIILFFLVLFLAVSPFGFDPASTSIQVALLVAPFAVLAVLTYYAGKAVVRDEAKLDGHAGEYANVIRDDDGANEALEADDEAASSEESQSE